MIRGTLNRHPRFLTAAEVMTLHESAVDEHGGSHGLRDPALLESALAMPRQGFQSGYAHEFPFGMAAAYGFHICKNHPFHDGNKRAAFAAMFQFLGLNGWYLRAAQDEAAKVFLDVATGAMDKEQLAGWIERSVAPRPALELRDFFARLDYAEVARAVLAMAEGPVNERVETILEAGRAIPCVHAASVTAGNFEHEGDARLAEISRQHAWLLTAIFRIAEDMGYEW